MDIEYDPTKNEKNISERQLSFERVREFQFESALIRIDERHDYGETRYVAVGYVGDRLHVLCFTETQTGIRVISFRKANDREAKHYGDRTQTTD
ncbi:BrnT family toxin [Paraburkholderia sp. Ac-20342]|uniref:BrnT family toxin n=1 Tax=Paraburkholderia sp. Ac-20342 TaxID=2703889 RepID=UPI00197EBB56|nr:BrnT family toxin [Paraburkholderia sp. Ac-20342]MBN3848364.1 BrnT family toxin [Paraburkholderia sp. Ac-20342]